MKPFVGVVSFVAACTFACAGAVEPPGPSPERDAGEVDGGADADPRAECDWSILECDDAHRPGCVAALAEVTCSAPIPDACKPCIRALP